MPHTVEPLEDRRLFAFGTQGVASLRFRVADATESVQVQQVLTDASGQTYVVADTKTTFQVQRLTAAGVLDTSWGKGGGLLFVRSARAGGAAEAHVDASGRLLVLQDDTLVRLDATGHADATFAGGSGVLKLADFSKVDDFSVDTNDKVYVTGAAAVGTKNIATRMRVERLISRGKRDTSFDGDGIYDLPFYKAATGTRTGQSEGLFVRSLPDGTTVAAGNELQGTTATAGKYTTKAVRAVRFNGAGVDTTYGTAGVATTYERQSTDITGYNVRPQGIRVSGQTVIYESGTSGGLDSTSDYQENDQFSADGKGVATVTGSGVGSNYTVTLDSAFTSGGTTQDLAVLGADQRSIAVLTADGSVAAAFHGGQPLRIGYGTDSDSYNAAAAQAADGTIIGAANNRGGFRVTVAKYALDGSVVTA